MKAAGAGSGVSVMDVGAFGDVARAAPPAPRQPAVFIGHGSPMNAVLDNPFTRALREAGCRYGRPAAALVVSAHWLTDGDSRVATQSRPATIHDFGGFPPELYRLRYPAPGQPDLAREAAAAVTSIRVHEDHEMGLDHGAWCVLRHLWPDAGVPVFQLSIDYGKPPGFHYDLGRELRGLRDRGVLVIGSGNIVHNLRLLRGDESTPDALDWAREFDAWVRDRIVAGDHPSLLRHELAGAAARMSVPTRDHYLPMLYVLGLLHRDETVAFTHEGFQHGSISMRCFESRVA